MKVLGVIVTVRRASQVREHDQQAQDERIAAEMRHMDDDRQRALWHPDWGPVPFPDVNPWRK